MQVMSRATVLLGALTIVALEAVPADAGDKPPRPEYGGTVTSTAHHHFETLFRKDGLFVFPRSMEGAALDASKVTAKATFVVTDVAKPFVYDLRPVAGKPGQAPTALGLGVDLSRVPSDSKVTFDVAGLAESEETTASFTVPFVLAAAPSASPAPVPARITYAKATSADQAAINAQRTCAVSGKPLGSMGGPLKVVRGDKAVFLCCQSCLGRVAADPDRYFGAPVAAAAAAVTASKPAAADQPAIAAQKTCPVSGEDLGSMGGPVKVTRGEQSIYLCCKACLKTIQANPEKYFRAAATGPKAGQAPGS